VGAHVPVLNVTVITSAMPIAVLPPLAHSITETLVSVASPQINVPAIWVPAIVHIGVLDAEAGPAPTPTVLQVAMVGGEAVVPAV
jgi:hypothetical protein